MTSLVFSAMLSPEEDIPSTEIAKTIDGGGCTGDLAGQFATSSFELVVGTINLAGTPSILVVRVAIARRTAGKI